VVLLRCVGELYTRKLIGESSALVELQVSLGWVIDWTFTQAFLPGKAKASISLKTKAPQIDIHWVSTAAL